MAHFLPMKSVMNMEQRLHVVHRIVNLNQTLLVRQFVFLTFTFSISNRQNFQILQSAGSCCQYSCQFYPSGHECRQESECKTSITCSGSSATCPEDDPSTFKADKTICGNGTLLCSNGLCELSICDLYSLLPCQLKQNENEFCMIACQQTDGSCVPFHQIDSKLDPSKPLYFPCSLRFFF